MSSLLNQSGAAAAYVNQSAITTSGMAPLGSLSLMIC